MLLAIPSNREKLDRHIVNACSYLNVKYKTFDIYSSDWIDRLWEINPDGCIFIPEFRYQAWRDLFSERIRFISNDLNIPIYPKLHEFELYESKRRMSYWLKANGITHPRTWVFGNHEEAKSFARSATYPLIFKTDFGNASFGVRKLNNKAEALSILERSFWNGYRVPFYNEGELDLKNRMKALIRPAYRKLRHIRNMPRDVELDVALFQEAINIVHEWRVIKAGDYYFGHEKVSDMEGFHSGSGHSKWTIPPLHVFDFARSVCLKGDFSTMSLDIFEDETGNLLVNELQTVFGVIAKNQMYRESTAELTGLRFYFDETLGEWKEEEGEFGQDYCYRLRINDFIRTLQNKRL